MGEAKRRGSAESRMMDAHERWAHLLMNNYAMILEGDGSQPVPTMRNGGIIIAVRFGYIVELTACDAFERYSDYIDAWAVADAGGAPHPRLLEAEAAYARGLGIAAEQHVLATKALDLGPPGLFANFTIGDEDTFMEFPDTEVAGGFHDA